ncbi:hypothetical protein [Shewanella sp.]|uniref:hypothetical protein n=2 Tax=Shewanella sp. TaxID=50422 RepID=UPI0040546461
MSQSFYKWCRIFSGEIVGSLLVGIMVGWMTFGLFYISIDAFSLDYALVTNVVIACTTIVAVLVHLSGLNEQEKIRRWELRKAIIFDLLASLSTLVRLNEEMEELNYRLNSVQSDEDVAEMPAVRVLLKNASSNWKLSQVEMENLVDNVLSVYKPIFSAATISSIDQFKNNRNELKRRSRQDWAEYEDLMADERTILLSLRDHLFDFVEKESGLN